MTGCIDIYGYAIDTGSWLLCGWAPAFSSHPLTGQHRLTLRFERGDIVGDALVVETIRGDLGDLGLGVAIHMPGSHETLGVLRSAEIAGQSESVVMQTTPDVTQANDAILIEALRAQRLTSGGDHGDRLRAVLRRTGFDGRDTLDLFEDQFAFKIDEAIFCGKSDILLNGWLMAAPPGVRDVRLRCGGRSIRLGVRDGVRIARPDVVAKYGDALRSRAANCGFILHVVACAEPGGIAYVEIEASNGDVAFVRLRPSRLRGLGAIRNTLAGMSPRYDEVQRTFDLIGPAISLLNEERLDAARTYREICFGTPTAAPACSVIVPLYGRIDYMEVQVALLAQGAFAQRHELIYVVDDPDSADAASLLADSLFRRFRLPLRLLLLEENVGFAPACNAGLSVAQGGHVCFLNSDVFSLQPDWLDGLLADFARHPSVGIVGPLLLFEDGTIQHQGMRYEALPEFSHWLFPVHPGKGSRPTNSRTLAVHPSITGACMAMSRELALDLGGFDEAYIIGDFEDSDLCLRARQYGVASAVDHGVVLYHLERKSQAPAAEAWRMNVTLYNAWLHQRRWAARLAADADGPRGRVMAAAAPPPAQNEPAPPPMAPVPNWQ